MESVQTQTSKTIEANLGYSAINWVNHCTYQFMIMQVGPSGMAVKIVRNDQVIYAETIPYNTPITINVGGDNGHGQVNGQLTATHHTLTFNGNLEQSNLVLTNMVVGLIK